MKQKNAYEKLKKTRKLKKCITGYEKQEIQKRKKKKNT